MTDPLWIAALLLAGLLIMMLEVFVPSGGVLGFLSIVSLVAAVGMAFMTRGVAVGVAVLAVTCAAVPLVLGVAFQFFPRTPLGRRVLPPPPSPEDVVPDVERRRLLRGLVGRPGRAEADMLPWGRVGRRRANRASPPRSRSSISRGSNGRKLDPRPSPNESLTSCLQGSMSCSSTCR